MAQFRLDYSKAQAIQISNDAFFFITEEEEPLDEKNLEEAQEVLSIFPNGFYVEEDWKYIKNSGLIEAIFIPYVEDEDDWDEYQDLTKYLQMQIKWLDANHIRAWLYNCQKCTRELQGDFRVYTTQNGHKCFHTGEQDKEFTPGKMSLYFLKRFSKRNTKNE